MRRRGAGIIGLGALGLAVALGPTAPVAAQQAPTTVTFVPVVTGSKNLSWTVPADVCEVTYRAAGAGGGSGVVDREGGSGGFATGTLAVAPGTVIYLFIGSAGGDGDDSFAAPDGRAFGGSGGSTGGRSGAYGDPQFGAGGGGGATDLRIGGVTPADRILVVGGGGGAGASKSEAGSADGLGGVGGDGGLVGTDGTGGATGGGDGGTGVAGGAGGDLVVDGSPGTATDGGAGGDGSSVGTEPIYAGGGGGAGWFGGGGGAAGGGTGTQQGMEVNGGGGGGGSSWGASGIDATFQTGEGAPADEDGSVAFTFTPGADCDADVPLTGRGVPLAATGLGLAAAGAWYLRRRATAGSVA